MAIPLSVIIGLAQLMLDDRSRNEIELLKKIKNAASTSLCSMNDLIDQTFIINGVFKKHYTNFDIYEAIFECIDMVEYEAKERKIKFKTNIVRDRPEWISCDRQRL